MASSYILIGVVLKPCGLSGEVRFKSFAASEESLKSYKIFYDDEALKEFKIKKLRHDKDDIFIVHFDAVESRTVAETLKNKKLYIHPSQLKKTEEDEYYHHQLEGLKVFGEKNQEIGVVTGISDYGSGDLLEVKVYDHLAPLLVPFNHLFVKEVNIKDQYILVDEEYMNALSTLDGT